MQAVLDGGKSRDISELGPAHSADPIAVALQQLVVLLEARLQRVETLNPVAPLTPEEPAAAQPPPANEARLPTSVFHLTPANDATNMARPRTKLYRRRSFRTACLLLLITAVTTTRVGPDRAMVAAVAAARDDNETPLGNLASLEPAPEPLPSPLVDIQPVDAPAPEAGPILASLAAANITPDARDDRLAGLLAHRADGMIRKRDIFGARKFYEYAANAGSARAAVALARTYNATYLAAWRVVGPVPDPTMEVFWVQRAAHLAASGGLALTEGAAITPRSWPIRHHTVRVRPVEPPIDAQQP